MKQAKGLYIVGVIGFSGQWSDDKLGSDPALRAKADEARAQLTNTLLGLKANHGDNLVVSSGATMEGVPKLVYEVCDSLGIDAMGVACEKAGKYELGKMKYFLPIGSEWGDESPAFLGTSDEILMIGGGGQAKREAIATATEGKPLTVFRGFGGSADDLSPDDVVGAKFVEGVN